MLAAQIVGPSGQVVGVERDARSVERGRVRAADAGLSNFTMIESDIATLGGMPPFDAVVGRFVLQFLPDATAALRSLSRLVRPGGIVVFQEVSWSLAQAANAGLSLWSACAAFTRDTIARTGADTDVGLSLHRIFLEAGIPAPEIQIEMKMGFTRDLILWVYDLLVSVTAGRPVEALGDLATLPERLEAEANAAQRAVASIAAVGAHARLS